MRDFSPFVCYIMPMQRTEAIAVAGVSDMQAGQLIARTHKCSCGRDHTVRTKAIDLREGAHGRLHRAMGAPQDVYLVCDERTKAAAADDVAAQLSAAGARVTLKVLPGEELHADEPTLGRALVAMPGQTQAIVGVGSGTINDSCRFLAFQTKRPYAIVGTAPSMDGYASTVTPLLVGGFKRTFDGVHPEAIFAEPAVLQRAPEAMIAAGAGDILGKHVALCDWIIARDVTGEYHCPELAAMMDRAIAAVVAATQGLKSREGTAVAGLTEALVLSGLAMQMAQSSRPASGFEHHLSHFWEMRLMSQGKPALLHGDKVGVGTLVAMEIYRRFFDKKRAPKKGADLDRAEGIRASFGALSDEVLVEATRVAHEAPSNTREARLERLLAGWDGYAAMAQGLWAKQAQTRAVIGELGGPTHPRQVGIDKAALIDSILWAKEVRPRYTLLRAVDDMGYLPDMAAEVAEALYG